MHLKTWDSVFSCVWFVIPLPILAKLTNKKGVLLAAIAFYLLGALEGLLLSRFDPQRSSLIDGVWLMAGLPASLLYSAAAFSIILLSKEALRRLGKVSRSK